MTNLFRNIPYLKNVFKLIKPNMWQNTLAQTFYSQKFEIIVCYHTHLFMMYYIYPTSDININCFIAYKSSYIQLTTSFDLFSSCIVAMS